MPERPVKSVGGRRRYEAPERARRAAATRGLVLDAAKRLFVDRGYAATSISDIAAEAGVNPDTVYASVGRKPELLRALIESALSGADHPIPAEERDYVAAIRACPDAAGKIAIYADAIGVIQERMAPILNCLFEAAAADPGCAAVWSEISERRAQNMLRFAQDLRATGQLRPDLDDRKVADIVWAMNGSELFSLLVRDRGWDREAFSVWLADAWRRMLLTPG